MNRKIACLVADPYPPYQFEEKGRIRGIDQETIQQAFMLRGVQISTVLLPWKECLRWMDQEKADGIFQIAPNEERRKLFLFSEKMRTERMSLFGKSGGVEKIQSDTDIRQILAGHTVGVLEGYTYGPGIDDLTGFVKLKYNNQEALLKGLLDGKADLVFMDAGVASYLAGKMGVSDINKVGGYAIERPLHLAFQKRHHQLAELFNAGLKEVKARAVDRRIFKRYGVRL